MTKRTDIKSILIIGAGPIVIGQGCEFDYSGAQACKSLREEGYRVILINSNPATIMTDPSFCDATYIEPITPEFILKIIEKERPDALLPTMGGQTALNCALQLYHSNELSKYSVELIGASAPAILKSEDREQFRTCMKKIGLEVPKAKIANNFEQAKLALKEISYPVIIRPSFTLGGSGGGIAYNQEDFEHICQQGLTTSPTHQILIEESLLGWKEFELEVVRDMNDNCIIVCSIENINPMGVHTGDSITVAPAQTLTDKEFQKMRTAAISVLREVGVNTGGANVQFAVHPLNGNMVVIEMNPRVSRSSALASKATGFPIAKIAAKLAVGYTLDELKNEITGGRTPASFEPSIDYVVVKFPRFNFEKFENSNPILTTQMKSVGEVMAIGRSFQESLQKAICSLEIDLYGLTFPTIPSIIDEIVRELENPTNNLIFFIAQAFRLGLSLQIINEKTHIDPWFLAAIEDLIIAERMILNRPLQSINKNELLSLKQKGFTDRYIATLLNEDETKVRALRHQFNIRPVFKRVDTCASEFKTDTAYLYSTYENNCESKPSQREKIIVLGSGSNRIGQGIEFDYCCVHTLLAIKEAGYESIIINCNPETVSTDYDASDRLYFEPLTLEHIIEIVAVEQPIGVIVQMGGQTPLKLTEQLEKVGVSLIGTPAKSIDLSEDRLRFSELIEKLRLKQPSNGIAYNIEESKAVAKKIGFPLIVRPSYVLGGRSMKIVYTEEELKQYMDETSSLSDRYPILLESFLMNSKEVDVDAISDGQNVFIGAILEQIENAGIHSGDSACSWPPHSLSNKLREDIKKQTCLIAKALSVIGPINIQFVIQNCQIFVIEANLRASRTFPFASKATGIPLAKVSTLCMLGISLKKQGILDRKNLVTSHYYVKQPIFSFNKFIGSDPKLSPEMKSTGEVMGIGQDFMEAYIKSLISAWPAIHSRKLVYIYIDRIYCDEFVLICKNLSTLGFELYTTAENAAYLSIDNYIINIFSLSEVTIKDLSLVIAITDDPKITEELSQLRKQCIKHNIIYISNLLSAQAFVTLQKHNTPKIVGSLQELSLRVENVV